MDCGGGVIRHPAHSTRITRLALVSPTDPHHLISFYRFVPVSPLSGQSAVIVGLYGRFRLPDRLPNSGRSSSGTSSE